MNVYQYWIKKIPDSENAQNGQQLFVAVVETKKIESHTSRSMTFIDNILLELSLISG